MSKISIAAIKELTRTKTVDYPSMPGFKITLGYISNELNRKIYKEATVNKFDSANGVSYPELDQEKFAELLCKHAIRGWEGLTVAGLSELLLINTDSLSQDEAVEYTEDNALQLYLNCLPLNKWLSNAVRELNQFRS